MDPISQGLLGAAFAQNTAPRNRFIPTAIVGGLAGMAPDLDVLIQSTNDPLLFLEFHRQFTHSLIFIPFGALIVSYPLYYLFRRLLPWRGLYLACLVGWATHGLLDACTSYGTQLFWPFSTARIAWDIVPIVDPTFTIGLGVLVVWAAISRRRWLALAANAWVVGYLVLGVVQHERALSAASNIAEARGHLPVRLSAKPAFGSLLLWKGIYEQDNAYYVDALRIAGDFEWCSGARIEKLDSDHQLPWLTAMSRQGRDLERFRWFSADHLAFGARDQSVFDVRYSMLPNQIDPLWGIRLSEIAAPDEHVEWWANRTMSKAQRETFIDLLLGRGCVPLSQAAS